MTTVAIVDDNPSIRKSLKEWVDSAPGHRCVCTCADAEVALKEVPKLKPDVVLMDIHLPGESGIACTARLKNLMPSLQIIVVTVYRDRDLLFQALKAGASGYLLKRSSPEEIIRAIAEVRSGGAPMTGEIARMVVETFQKPTTETPPTAELSAREMELLDLVAKGLTNKEIGPMLNISYDTVRAHLRRIYEKLHVRCRTEAVMKYSQNSQ
ncbi:MAG TPA: response regulator transcription factor [Verrucomicrobiae bacterium]|nr:response regulator transcription factor [Verrucomicrobiae bacterium]